MVDNGIFHPVGACILHVIGASLSELSNPHTNLIVADSNDSMDEDGPALFEIAASSSMKRYRIGRTIKGFLSDRMEARSFWWGLGHRAGIKLEVQALPDAKLNKDHNWGNNSAIPILIIVKAQCDVFDVREFKKGERGNRDQRPGRALNALLKYCESEDLPEECKPFYNVKALKALTKRPLAPKDLGDAYYAATSSGAVKAESSGNTKGKAIKKAAVKRKSAASIKAVTRSGRF